MGRSIKANLIRMIDYPANMTDQTIDTIICSLDRIPEEGFDSQQAIVTNQELIGREYQKVSSYLALDQKTELLRRLIEKEKYISGTAVSLDIMTHEADIPPDKLEAAAIYVTLAHAGLYAKKLTGKPRQDSIISFTSFVSEAVNMAVASHSSGGISRDDLAWTISQVDKLRRGMLNAYGLRKLELTGKSEALYKVAELCLDKKMVLN
jgi:hypothetical protein